LSLVSCESRMARNLVRNLDSSKWDSPGAVQKVDLGELLRLFFYFSYGSWFKTVITGTDFRFLWIANGKEFRQESRLFQVRWSKYHKEPPKKKKEFVAWNFIVKASQSVFMSFRIFLLIIIEFNSDKYLMYVQYLSKSFNFDLLDFSYWKFRK